MTPRTSFIVPARNAAATLAQTLASLLAQGDADWEALVVDDGSSDDTPQLIAAHAERDARFIALRGSGTDGVAAARNVGLQQARGRRVVFLDSDDWIAPTFLERMHAALDAAPGAAAVWCDHQRVMPGGALAAVESDAQLATAPFDTFARSCVVAIHAVLIDRERVLRAGGFDSTLRTCEDWDLWQRIARMGGAWVHVAEPLAFYRMSAHSLSQDAASVRADGERVIRCGFGTDPRLAAADNAHPHGASRDSGASAEIALAYFGLWCHAFEAARGTTRSEGQTLLLALPSSSEHAPHVAATLLDALTASLLVAAGQLAARWANYGPRLTTLIGALGVIWHDAVAARRVQYAFERMLLQRDDLAAPRALALTLGLRVNLRAPPPVTPPEGIDRYYAQLCDDAQVLAAVEPGTLGTFTPRQWIELAAHRVGWPMVRHLVAPSVARSATPRALVDAVHSVRAVLRQPALREQGWRAVARSAAHEALLAAASPADGAGGHGYALQRLREQAERAAPARLHAPLHAGATRPTDEPPSADGRRAHWEDFFRSENPWNSNSANEQERHAFQLELLPDRAIGAALELACAEGHFSAKLAPRLKRLIATDLSATALARAAGRCRGHANIEFRQLDLAADSLPHGMDLIVCSEVLYYLDDEAELRRVCEHMAAALAPGGHIVAAHALAIAEDMAHTGFDWGSPWSATTIARVFAEVPGLALERSLCTELYRVDRFVRLPAGETAVAPQIETRHIEAEIEPEVARYIIWGGAAALRSELAQTERHERIPVLAYHRIADDGPPALARYRVSKRAFAEQLGWLRRHGYHALVSDELAGFLQNRQPFPGRPVMLTFDDGYQDFADSAWPLLRRHDFRAEVFVVTDLVGRCAEWDRCYGEPAALMEARTIAALASEGARFGSHLATHRGADGLATRELAEELLRSQQCIERWTGLAPCALAAPFGLSDERLRLLAAECGYRIGLGMESGPASLGDDPMHLSRIEVRGDMALAEFTALLEDCR